MILGLLPDWLDPSTILETGSYLLLFAIIFAETGLLIGFFLPGDSLLFTAGVFAAKGDLNIAIVAVGCLAAAIIGDQAGFLLGRRVGPSLFSRPESRLFHHKHVERAQEFFDEHGPKTIVLARFVPIVRTFAPILAGVGRMEYRTFVTFNIIGGALWGLGVTMLGYVAGEAIGEENIDRYLLPIIGLIVLASVLPVLREAQKHRREAAARGGPEDLRP